MEKWRLLVLERGGRIAIKQINGTKNADLRGFIKQNVKQGATVDTDEHSGYTGLEGYDHETIKHSAKEYVIRYGTH